MQCVHGQRKSHGFERHRPHSKRCGRGGRFIRVLYGRAADAFAVENWTFFSPNDSIIQCI